MRDAALGLRAPSRGAPLLAVRVEVEPGHEVEEVLPRALAAPLPEGGELRAQDVVLGQRLDELDEHVLALARHPRRDVHEAVRVRADEVERAVHEPLLGERVVHGGPPAARHARVAHLRAAQHPHAQVHAPVGHQRQPLAEALAPRAAQARPVLRRPAEHLRALVRGRVVVGRPARRALTHADLVPLDLEGHERGDQVVHVGGAGEQHRVRAVAGVVPAAPAGGRVGLLPLVDHDAVLGEDLRLLAHDHELRAGGHAVGEPPDRVDQRAEVRLVAVGERMQARAHRAVRRLEHAQVRLAARAQQRVVGALVELDLVAEAPRVLVEGAGQGQPGYDQELLLHVRHADCGGRSGTADDAGHHDQGQDIGQRLE